MKMFIERWVICIDRGRGRGWCGIGVVCEIGRGAGIGRLAGGIGKFWDGEIQKRALGEGIVTLEEGIGGIRERIEIFEEGVLGEWIGALRSLGGIIGHLAEGIERLGEGRGGMESRWSEGSQIGIFGRVSLFATCPVESNIFENYLLDLMRMLVDSEGCTLYWIPHYLTKRRYGHSRGARYLLIKFDERCCTEDCCDILTIASDNKYKHNVRTFSGSSGNWINFDIPGDTLYYKFVSDFNNNDWGFKFTVIGNHVGRFETGFVLLDSVLQCSGLVSSISLPTLWASLIEVCNKQVGHPRLKSIRLLLRILQYISSEGNTSCHSDVETKDDASLGVDLTLLKPLWFLLNQMNNNLSEDSTTCQSIHAAHSALTELFFFVENLVKSKDLVESYISALVDEEEIKASVRQGLCNVAAIGSAIGVPNKASLLLEKEEKTATPRYGTTVFGKNCSKGQFAEAAFAVVLFQAPVDGKMNRKWKDINVTVTKQSMKLLKKILLGSKRQANLLLHILLHRLSSG
ncbi:putative zinc finger ZZ-type and EF-hand domain-containing protein 1 [Apostichopus japonicus]|uniref:Putative zinc finger ZZ-type and EF-hand domain-containing protein 1 n=1 Tax=Stichopus japonicus TaxID=307972 RepID=A0A2G8KV22_STIJA|nr:putative zinc finger ZZ-type and EF-hand domain-containing protein 1 [Apostichopus japonicus]